MYLRILHSLNATAHCCHSQSKFTSAYSRCQSVAWRQQCLRQLSCHRGILWKKRQPMYLKLIQLYNHVRARCCMWKLRFLLRPHFDEHEFIVGTKQAASVMIDAVRTSDWNTIRKLSTLQGASEIYHETQSYRKNLYTSLVRFQPEHLHIALPVDVVLQRLGERWYVAVDVAFVGMRNMQDFKTNGEQQEVMQLMQRVLAKSTEMPANLTPGNQRIAIGQTLLTFRHELTAGAKLNESPSQAEGWLVDSFQIYKFQLVNYSTLTMRYCVIEFLNLVK